MDNYIKLDWRESVASDDLFIFKAAFFFFFHESDW